MAKVYALIADGSEEIECLAPVDLLRRANVDTKIVSVCDRTVTGSHGIKIESDALIDEVDLTDADLLFIPGGMPGSVVLAEHRGVTSAVRNMLDKGKRVAAICAAPALVLGAHGFLRGIKAVCFPGYEDKMIGAVLQADACVVTDGTVTTARGFGCATDLGLELVRLLAGDPIAETIIQKIQYRE